MSTIRVDNFAPSAGGTEFGIEGIAKAWSHINGGSGTPSLDANYNVSSITDDAVGQYSVSLTNSFASSNYSVVVGGVSASNLNGGCPSGNATGSYSTNYRNSSNTYLDTDNANSAAFGDLA